jgi:hypothetical protein
MIKSLNNACDSKTKQFNQYKTLNELLVKENQNKINSREIEVLLFK